MKVYPIILLLIILLITGTDYFFFHKLKKRFTSKFLHFLSFLPGILFIFLFIYMRFFLGINQNFLVTSYMMWIVFAFLLIYLPKAIYIIFHFVNFSAKKIIARQTNFFRWCGVLLSLITMIIIVYGGFISTRNFQVRYTNVYIKTLPLSFHDFKIIQLSDFHLGNWNNDTTIMNKIIPLVNAQNADIIVFTGDMVNNFWKETSGWEQYFQQMKARYGKFAILGNHDYGDYSHWPNLKLKEENLLETELSIKKFGFKLLKNEHIFLRINHDSIAIIGVENWGTRAKFNYGNLSKALKGTEKCKFNILLSHDPSHWDAEVVGKQNIFLTLSGHTHASQIGFYFNDKLFSPSSYIFKEWDGLYQTGNQYLFINRGIGFVGVPMRIGVPPEISVITLKE